MKVLVVDDDDDVRTITRLSLATGGLNVVEASGGREALGAARLEQPDLILLDVMMPGMDGPQTLAQLRAHEATASIPVVFLTAKAMPAEVHRLRALGACGVLSKPFDPLSLAAAVRAFAASVTSARSPSAVSASSRPCSAGSRTSPSPATTS